MAGENEVAHQQECAVDVRKLEPCVRLAERRGETLAQLQALDERLNQRMRTDLIRLEPKLVLLGVHRPTSTAHRLLTHAWPYCMPTAGLSQRGSCMHTGGDERRQQALQRQDEQYRATAAELARVGYVLQGSIGTRWMTCGKAACRCTDDPAARHGPYHAWTYKRGGKTVCVYLTAEQAAICSEWIKNNRRLERLVARLRAIARRIAQLEKIPSK